MAENPGLAIMQRSVGLMGPNTNLELDNDTGLNRPRIVSQGVTSTYPEVDLANDAPIKVLAVDDDPFNIFVVKRFLKDSKHTFDLVEADTGAEAVKIFDNQHTGSDPFKYTYL